MTIYNVFSLLAGIYLANIVIDILIFASPSFTKKLVKSAILSFLASIAFLYLMYKSYSEAFHLIQHVPSETGKTLYTVLLVGLFAYLLGRVIHGKVKQKRLSA